MASQTRKLVCSNNEPFLGPHDKCRAETARVCGVPISEVLLPDYSKYARKIDENTIESVPDAPRPG